MALLRNNNVLFYQHSFCLDSNSNLFLDTFYDRSDINRNCQRARRSKRLRKYFYEFMFHQILSRSLRWRGLCRVRLSVPQVCGTLSVSGLLNWMVNNFFLASPKNVGNREMGNI